MTDKPTTTTSEELPQLSDDDLEDLKGGVSLGKIRRSRGDQPAGFIYPEASYDRVDQ